MYGTASFMICEATDRETLEEVVTSKMRSGWELAGSAFFVVLGSSEREDKWSGVIHTNYQGIWCQPMTKVERQGIQVGEEEKAHISVPGEDLQVV